MHGPDNEFYDELVSTLASGVVGRGMYDASGAWGQTIPFPGTLFVLTHRTADQPAAETGFRFRGRPRRRHSPRLPRRPGTATSALGGGADLIRQALAAEKVDKPVVSTAQVILGAGKRLFDGFGKDGETSRWPRCTRCSFRHSRALQRRPVAAARTCRRHCAVERACARVSRERDAITVTSISLPTPF